jgi:hypothetical protein
MAKQKIYIPTYISSINYDPARVLPRIFFYNGTLETDAYYIQNNSGSAVTQSVFPYFDNYSGNLPTTSSLSLLFNNETSVYGQTPSASLYSEYWSTYVNLLYNPYTRVINCKAIIPLADYYKIELNDIVEWRGNYYHLRAINDYNLSNGECQLQLLGPVIDDVIANVLPGEQCNFDFSIEDYTQPGFLISRCDDSAQLQVTFTSSLSMSVGDVFTLPAEYALNECWYVSGSFSGSFDLQNVSISQSFATCEICSSSLHPSASCCTPTITTASLSGGNVEIYFTTSSYCAECQQTRTEISLDNVNWQTPISTSCVSPNVLGAPTASVYYRMYQICSGSVSSSYSNTWYYQSGSAPIEQYKWYLVDRYNCNGPTNPCTLNTTGLVGRTSSSVSLISGNYYNVGDGYSYLVDTEIASQSIDVDLWLAASAGTDCMLTCMI